MTGSSAVTRPPGLVRQLTAPSGSSTRSTGSRLATTTKSCCPGAGPETGPASAPSVDDIASTLTNDQPNPGDADAKIRLSEFLQVLRQHVPPGVPVVFPLRAPVVHPVGDALGAQGPGHLPGRADVLPVALARGQDGPPGPQPVQLRALQAGQELQRRGEEQVLAPGLVVEALDPVAAAHADRRGEHVRVTAQH